MSDSIHRRRITSPDASRGRSSRTRRPKKHQLTRRIPTKIRSKSTKILHRSFSEPNLHQSISVEDVEDDRLCSTPVIHLPSEEPEQIVYLPEIRSEVFASAPSLSGFSSPSSSSSPINQLVSLVIIKLSKKKFVIIKCNSLFSPSRVNFYAIKTKYLKCYKLAHRFQSNSLLRL